MIVYERSGVSVAEFHFDECADAARENAGLARDERGGGEPRVDVLRHYNYSAPLDGTRSYEFHTLQSDLSRDPDWLLGRMSKATRNEIRQAERRLLVRYEYRTGPDREWMQGFFDYFDGFASWKGIEPVNRGRLRAMLRSGLLDLSRVVDREGRVLAWHAHLVANGRARFLYSASVRGAEHTPHAEISRANRFHVWSDMLRFRETGCTIYDFGGWYAGSVDRGKLGVNRFKESFGGDVVRLHDIEHGVTWKGKAAVLARWGWRKWTRDC